MLRGTFLKLYEILCIPPFGLSGRGTHSCLDWVPQKGQFTLNSNVFFLAFRTTAFFCLDLFNLFWWEFWILDLNKCQRRSSWYNFRGPHHHHKGILALLTWIPLWSLTFTFNMLFFSILAFAERKKNIFAKGLAKQKLRRIYLGLIWGDVTTQKRPGLTNFDAKMFTQCQHCGLSPFYW